MSQQTLAAVPADAREPGAQRFTALGCPTCPGVLLVAAAGETHVLSFRCRIGHVFTLTELILAKELVTEDRLWAAVEALEELAAVLRDTGGDGERVRRAMAHAAAIRRIIEGTEMAHLDAEAGATCE